MAACYRLFACAALAALLPFRVHAQGAAVPTRTVGKALVEMAEPYSAVQQVRELRDGRLIVLDVKDNALHSVSADLRTARAVSREGSGPLEFRRLVQLIPWRGDTTYAYDIMNARFLVLDQKGEAAKTLSLRDASGGLPVGPMAVKGYDQRGRLYYQGINFSMGKSGPQFADSAPLLRLDSGSKRTDTLTWVRLGMPGVKMSGDVEKGGGAVRLGMSAFPVVDEWAILPDGRVVILRGSDYRVDWIGVGGERMPGNPVPYTRIRVTDADKRKVREANQTLQKEVSKAAAQAAAQVPGQSRATMPSMTVDAPTTWPEYKPAFGQGALRVSPTGELWVGRLRAAGDEAQLYDVLDAKGVLRYRVQLPPRSRLVGIGTRYLYIVRDDEDDLEYIGRYPIPR